MTRFRLWHTRLFSGHALYGIQDESTGRVLLYELGQTAADGWQYRLHEQAGVGILLKPRTVRTVFEVFLADVRMLSKANIPADLLSRAIDDMIDRWNNRRRETS